MGHRSLLNESVAYWRDQNCSLRYLTPRETDWWFGRLQHAVQARKLDLAVPACGREFIMSSKRPRL